jgi:outer membrane immunogenic protein
VDFEAGEISGSASRLNPYNTLDTYGYKSQLNWWGTVRGRLGYAFGPALLYATGGFAFGQIDSQVTYSSHYPSVCCGASPSTIAYGRNNKSEVDGGWVVGGGLEYALNPRWSIKGEYQFIDLGNSDTATNYCYLGCTTNELHAKVDNQFNLVFVGVNYHTGGGYVPLK